MQIMPVGFGKVYTNPSGNDIRISEKGVIQAKTTARIRSKLDNAIKDCPDDVINSASKINANESDLREVYFTINEKGEYAFSNEKIPEVLYQGKLYLKPDSRTIIDIYAKQATGFKSYVDMNRHIASESGVKFAYLPESEKHPEIYKPEVYPE